MTVKQLNAKIDALGKVNAHVEAKIQELGLACLEHCGVHHDTMPMNRLVNVLRRTQHKAFVEWCLAFGQFKVNVDFTTKAQQPLAYDKTRITDIEAAAAKEWFMFGEEKTEAISKCC
jgi:heme/copper-type cytochrome/quinol oxidase subunit 2